MFANCYVSPSHGLASLPVLSEIDGVRQIYWTLAWQNSWKFLSNGWGRDFEDGARDVRVFRRAMVDSVVSPVKSLLMRSAMSVARTVSDPSGNSPRYRKRVQAGTIRQWQPSWPSVLESGSHW